MRDEVTPDDMLNEDPSQERFAIEDPLGDARGQVLTVQAVVDDSNESRLNLATALALISIGRSLEQLVEQRSQ